MRDASGICSGVAPTGGPSADGGTLAQVPLLHASLHQVDRSGAVPEWSSRGCGACITGCHIRDRSARDAVCGPSNGCGGGVPVVVPGERGAGGGRLSSPLRRRSATSSCWFASTIRTGWMRSWRRWAATGPASTCVTTSGGIPSEDVWARARPTIESVDALVEPRGSFLLPLSGDFAIDAMFERSSATFRRAAIGAPSTEPSFSDPREPTRWRSCSPTTSPGARADGRGRARRRPDRRARGSVRRHARARRHRRGGRGACDRSLDRRSTRTGHGRAIHAYRGRGGRHVRQRDDDRRRGLAAPPDYGLYALARALGVKYVHTPLGRVDYQGFLPLLTGRTDPGFVARYNEFFSLPSDDFDLASCQRVPIHILNAETVERWRAHAATTGRPVLLQAIHHYGYTDHHPASFARCAR